MGRLDRSPRANWVEQRGGLPDYIDRIAVHIHEKGAPIGVAVATAINAAKKMCATGDLNWPGLQNVNTGSRAEACAAVAQWEAMKSGGKTATAHGASDLVQQLVDGGTLVSRHLPDGTLELAHLDRHGFVLALARHVRTEAGVRRYHLPIGSLIGSGKPGDAVRELRLHHQGKTATIRRTADGKIERRNPDRSTWRPATQSETTIFQHAEKRHDAEHAAIAAGGKPQRGADFVKSGEKTRAARAQNGPMQAPKSEGQPGKADAPGRLRGEVLNSYLASGDGSVLHGRDATGHRASPDEANYAALTYGVKHGTITPARAEQVRKAQPQDFPKSLAGAPDEAAIRFDSVSTPPGGAVGRMVFNPQTGDRIKVIDLRVQGDKVTLRGRNIDKPDGSGGTFTIRADQLLAQATGAGPNPLSSGQRRTQLWRVDPAQNTAERRAADKASRAGANQQKRTAARRKRLSTVLG